MNDREFLEALEDCRLDPAAFNHAAHVRATYLYLRQGTFGAAIDRTSEAIRRFAASLGKAERYHDTITVAFVALIRQRMIEHGDAGNWPAFAAANPDLFQSDLLLRHYPRDLLESAAARRVFVLPVRPSPIGIRPAD